eukprot:Nitzschia sp. Nitz4//scaffold44_size153857//108545//109174//NITZ4_002736-RA/size153857-processed-gene-0.132-mRNA-1//1//CDS//3329552202//3729//frame0
MDEDNFFAMPPAEETPAYDAGEGDFTMVGDAPPAEAPPVVLMGDVSEVPPPAEDAGDMGFAAAPVEDTPIILGAAPPEEDVVVEEEPVPAPVMEASAMQKWNEEWQVTLSARKDEETSKKAEMIAAAKADLETFQAAKETKREAKMAKNREDEQAKLEAIEADLENDNSWQRICKLVDLSHAEDHDVKRMRDVMILLKNDPARAAAVGA